MANVWYQKGLEGVAKREIDFLGATIKAVAVLGYTPDTAVAGHATLADVTGAGGGTIVATTAALTGKTITGAVFDADDSQFADVPTGPPATMIVVVQSSAVGGGADVAANLQRLLLVDDTATNMPFTPNGGDVDLTWDNGANKLARL